jgi:arabinogalactan endo-1,4-beta-galactosidase
MALLFENQAFYDFNNRALPVWQVLINKKIWKFTNTFAIRFDVFTGFSNFFAVRPKNIQSTSKSSFAKGADVGWLPQMEATGYKFYDTDGMKRLFTALKDRGMNTIRLVFG